MPKKTLNHKRKLDASDLNTIIVALRLFQKHYEDKDAVEIANDWPDYFELLDQDDVRPVPLGSRDIKQLCADINFGKVTF